MKATLLVIRQCDFLVTSESRGGSRGSFEVSSMRVGDGCSLLARLLELINGIHLTDYSVQRGGIILGSFTGSSK